MSLNRLLRPAILKNIQAGTTTAVMLVPQGMAYALVAGVSPVHGLYASLLPLVVYALLGRSRELAIGPGALDTLIIGVTVSGIAAPGSGEAASLAALMALQVAGIQLILGVVRAGFLINFLSRPVVSGFTSAAALTIAMSQAANLVGIHTEHHPLFFQLAFDFIAMLGSIHLPTALVGLGSAVFIMVMKKHWRSFPSALFVVAATTLLAALFDLEEAGVVVLGDVPASLPVFALPAFNEETFFNLLPASAAVAAVGYLSVISIAKTFADKNRYDISPDREMAALGAANLASAFSQGFAVSASFSRSAVHSSAGSTSPRSLLVTAGWIMLTLVFFAPVLYSLPRATLAAIIITAVIGLVDLKMVSHLYRAKQQDMWLLLLTFAATLTVGIIEGILTGAGASLALFVIKTTRPHAAVLGRVGTSSDYRNVKNYPEARTIPGVLVLRIDAQFYFGNVTFLKDLLKKLEGESKVSLRAVIIEAASMNQLDSSAEAALSQIALDYRSRGIRLMFATVKMPVMRVMQASGLVDLIGPENFFMNVHSAVKKAAEK